MQGGRSHRALAGQYHVDISAPPHREHTSRARQSRDGGRSVGAPWRLAMVVVGARPLSALAPPKAAAAPKPRGSPWADPLPSQRRSGKRPPDGAHRALAARIGAQLRCRHLHHSPRNAGGVMIPFGLMLCRFQSDGRPQPASRLQLPSEFVRTIKSMYRSIHRDCAISA
jgi:hypothetical protein